MTMRKSTIIDSIYGKSGLLRQESKSAVESTFEIIKQELEKGGEVSISGFGKWKVREKKPRKGRNPQTGKAITISGRRVVSFKCSNVFRKSIKSAA